ncbi:hypothetical protein SNEBB_001669 [Seison nebaliae]|nr:hypothetical protein SNEBB_001669 [Seison nebaliae]
MDFYGEKVILGPMVRIGTMPIRLLSLRYGADLVYSPEIIDKNLIGSQYHYNDHLKCHQWYSKGLQRPLFETCDEEKGKVILQLGTASPELAVKAAKKLEEFVAGVDINMGCPKSFSIHCGMGAALLKNPVKIEKILKELKKELKIPVTCKIRLLESIEDTKKLVKIIESTNIDAIAIHGRRVNERPKDLCRFNEVEEIAKYTRIPVILNGISQECSEENVKKMKYNLHQCPHATSLMLSRSAEWNPSIFLNKFYLFDKSDNGGSSIKLENILDVIIKFINLSEEYEGTLPNMKYCIQNMLVGNSMSTSNIYRQVLATTNKGDLKELFLNNDNLLKRPRIECDILDELLQCRRSRLISSMSPKSLLHHFHELRVQCESTTWTSVKPTYSTNETISDRKLSYTK